MLSIRDAEYVGFDSIWKVTKVTQRSTESQTDNILTTDSEIGAAEKRSIETQTDIPQINYEVKYDSVKLENFLKRIYPSLASELDEEDSPQIFKNYCPFDEPIYGKAKLLQTINVNLEEDSDNNAPRVNNFSWNSTGNTVAVTSDYLHKTWCHHNGYISLYSFDRYEALPEIPIKKLKTGSCVTTLAFHPEQPNVISAGTHTGEIYLWNIQNEEENTLVDKIVGHEDTITDMQWTKRTDYRLHEIILVTSSTDGFITVWKFNLKIQRLLVKKKYKIKPPLFNKISEDSTADCSMVSLNPGVLSFHFCYETPETFVVAAEGGHVIQCSTLGAKVISGSEKLPVLNPCITYYEPHTDQITTIRFSPNHKDQFLTNSIDGQIRIYVLDQEYPARVFFVKSPLLSVSWIPFHDKLIAGCGQSGIHVFNVITSERLEDFCDDKCEDLIQIQTNTKRPTTVITGSSNGKMHLWTVPWGSLSLCTKNTQRNE